MNDNSFRIDDNIVVNKNTDKYNNMYGQIVSVSQNVETGENVYYCEDLENGSCFWAQHSDDITLA